MNKVDSDTQFMKVAQRITRGGFFTLILFVFHGTKVTFYRLRRCENVSLRTNYEGQTSASNLHLLE